VEERGGERTGRFIPKGKGKERKASAPSAKKFGDPTNRVVLKGENTDVAIRRSEEGKKILKTRGGEIKGGGRSRGRLGAVRCWYAGTLSLS